MRNRKAFVGVDAHIDPYDARPYLRYAAANLPLPNGRTEASAPTGRCAFSLKMHTILRLHSAGESAASTPTDRLHCRCSLCDFDGAPCAGGASPSPALRRSPAQKRTAHRGGSFSYLFQHSFAPAGILSSTMMRFSFSSPCSVCTADSSIPQDSRPIILRGGRFTIATSVLPTRASGS